MGTDEAIPLKSEIAAPSCTRARNDSDVCWLEGPRSPVYLLGIEHPCSGLSSAGYSGPAKFFGFSSRTAFTERPTEISGE